MRIEIGLNVNFFKCRPRAGENRDLFGSRRYIGEIPNGKESAMVYGPFPVFFVEKLKATLAAEGAQTTIYNAAEAKDLIHQRQMQREPEQPEYHCPKCDFVAPMPTQCPKHKIRLLGFSEWVAERSARQSKFYGRLIIVALAILAFVIYRNS